MYINHPLPQRMPQGGGLDVHTQQRLMSWNHNHARPAAPSYTTPYPPVVPSPRLALPPNSDRLWPSPDPSTASPSPDPTAQRGIKRRREDSCGPPGSDYSSCLASSGAQQPPRNKFRPTTFHLPPSATSHLQTFWQLPQQHTRGIMAAGDEWGFSDDMSDPFEARELQNGFLNGAAGSPFSGYPDRSMFANQFSQYYRGNPHAIDLYNFGLAGGGGGAGAGFMDGSFSVPANGAVNVNAPDYAVLSAPRLTDFHMPDITSLSVFSPDGLPMSHGMPIQHQGSGMFTTAAGAVGGGDMASSSAFGSFSSASGGPPSVVPAFGSSFSSTSTGCRGSATDSVQAPHLGLAGDAWQDDANGGTMSPKDLPLKRASSLESLDEPSSTMFLERDEELQVESDSDSDDDEAHVMSRWRHGGRQTTPPPTKPKQRKSLPDKAPRPLKAVSHKKTPEMKPKPVRKEPTPTKSKAKTIESSPPSSRAQKKQSRPSPRKILPSPRMANPRPARSPPSDAREPSTISPSSSRSAKDEFLLASKQKGMTYREIREAGRFTEAESTLRGRYRTLTKSKEERVRKPEWSDKDINLLRKAVRTYGRRSDADAVLKVPWKQVAEYIHDRGGSYLFGNATCRKKWDELVTSEVRDDDE